MSLTPVPPAGFALRGLPAGSHQFPLLARDIDVIDENAALESMANADPDPKTQLFCAILMKNAKDKANLERKNAELSLENEKIKVAFANEKASNALRFEEAKDQAFVHGLMSPLYGLALRCNSLTAKVRSLALDAACALVAGTVYECTKESSLKRTAFLKEEMVRLFLEKPDMTSEEAYKLARKNWDQKVKAETEAAIKAEEEEMGRKGYVYTYDATDGPRWVYVGKETHNSWDDWSSGGWGD